MAIMSTALLSESFCVVLVIIALAGLINIQSATSLKSRLDQPALVDQLFSKSDIADHHHHHPSAATASTNIFEVTTPIDPPPHMIKPCSVLLLNQSFANYTLNSPPFVIAYNPSQECGLEWEKVILKWRATCRGRQFDRFLAVWLSGVEIFRSTTGEPTRHGVHWQIEKDVTRFATLFKEAQTLVMSLPNFVNKTYTGIFHVTVTLDFYARNTQKGDYSKVSSHAHADMVLPVAEASPLNGGHWFQLQGATDVRYVSVTLPSNVYKATLEICVSFHGEDEFWYTNPPNDYIEANNLTDQPGNGPFREVVALIDELVGGVVWPFPVVYTGGINPRFWRPVVAIGAFHLPSYDFDITPYLGVFGDGKAHNISLKVTNALSFWLVNANLHLWLDPSSVNVAATLLGCNASDVRFNIEESFTGVDGSVSTKASRSIYSEGYVISSYGNITTSSFHTYEFLNLQIYNKTTSVIDQNIETKSRDLSKIGSRRINLNEESNSYPFSLVYVETDLPNGTIIVNTSISHALNKHIKASNKGSSSLHNVQATHGIFWLESKLNRIIDMWTSLTQNYSFQGKGKCYCRSLSVANNSILSDSDSIDHEQQNCSFNYLQKK